MKISFLAVIAAALSISLGSCTGSADIESQIRSAEMAVAQGDMTAARSVAAHIVDKENLYTLPASQLARLSIVYMQLSDYDTDESENSVSTAAALYRQAYEVDADSAALYFSVVTPDKQPYVQMLSTLVGNIDNPYDISSDTLDVDTYSPLLDSGEPPI